MVQKGWETKPLGGGGLKARMAAFEALSKPKGDNSAAISRGPTDPNVVAKIRAAQKAAREGQRTPTKKQYKNWDTKTKGTPPSIEASNDGKENNPEEAEAKAKEEAELEAGKVAEAKAKAEAEAKAKAEAEAKEKAEAEAKAKEAMEKRAKEEAEAKVTAEAEAKAKAEAEAKAKEEAEAKAKAEAEEKAKAEAEAKAKAEEEARIKAEKDKAATKIQAKARSVLARARVMKMIDQMIADLTQKKEDNEKKYEEEKEAWEKEQSRRKVKIQEERKRSRMSLAVTKVEVTTDGWGWGFIGPLQLPIARIPHWWMDLAPHKTYFSEDFEDKEEEYWKFRQAHLEKLRKEEEALNPPEKKESLTSKVMNALPSLPKPKGFLFGGGGAEKKKEAKEEAAPAPAATAASSDEDKKALEDWRRQRGGLGLGFEEGDAAGSAPAPATPADEDKFFEQVRRGEDPPASAPEASGGDGGDGETTDEIIEEVVEEVVEEIIEESDEIVEESDEITEEEAVFVDSDGNEILEEVIETIEEEQENDEAEVYISDDSLSVDQQLAAVS